MSFTQDDEPSLILPWLYLGTYRHAANQQVLQRHGITHVLDVEEGGKKPDHLAEDNYLGRGMSDFGTTKVEDLLEELFAFIESVENQAPNCKLLIQCEWGVNRSTTITCCYLVARLGFSLRKALKHCRAKRSCTRPRDEYIQQLMELERKFRPNALPFGITRAASDEKAGEEFEPLLDFSELQDIYPDEFRDGWR